MFVDMLGFFLSVLFYAAPPVHSTGQHAHSSRKGNLVFFPATGFLWKSAAAVFFPKIGAGNQADLDSKFVWAYREVPAAPRRLLYPTSALVQGFVASISFEGGSAGRANSLTPTKRALKNQRTD